MAYTWTNKTKAGGVGLTGKIVLKGKDDFPLMYANDLDWANVEVENGVNLNTTDDLLDYIKGGNSSIIGRIDELELSNAGYEIRCDKSVCYVGDTLNRVSILVYKNGTLLSWPDILADGITLKSPITKPTGANDLIQFTSNGQWLNGTANKAGAYVFEFVKGASTASEVCVASFMLTVLVKPIGSYQTTIYISSQSKPETPTGGSYDFDSKVFTAPTGWSTNTTGLSTPIWFSTGTVFSDGNTTPTWSEPCIYMDSEIVQREDEHRVRGVAVYKVARGPYTYNGTDYLAQTPARPTAQNLYTFNADSTQDSFTAPSGWYKEPEAAITAYKNGLTNSEEDKIKKLTYRIWKTYNSYSITVTDGVLVNDTYAESGWSNPTQYLNIDKILEDAKSQSELIALTALQNAYADLNLAEDLETVVDAINSVFAWCIIGDGSSTLSSISSKYTELVDDVDTSSAQHTLFSRFNSYFDSNTNKYSGHIEMINENPLLCVSGYQMKALKFDPVYEGGESKGSKWIAFIPTTTEIRNQISDLNEDLGELSTAVNAMNPHEIRLLVSKGFKKDVTWTEVDVTEWKSARTIMEEDPDDEEYDIDYDDTIRHDHKTDSSNNWEPMEVSSINDDFINALPADPYDLNHSGGFKYGHYYRVHYGSYSIGDPDAGYKYFRCDYPVSTGFLNILADKVNLGVADTQGGKATLLLKVKDGNGTASVVANLIVLDGETIADAISAKSLNINNTTYLCSDGDVYMGVPNGTTVNPDALDKSSLNTGSGSSRFNHDGSGQLCGGNINWTNNGVLYVKEAHIGESNSDWLIKTLISADNIYDKDGLTKLMCPVIFAKDSISGQQYHDELFITPQYIFACNSQHESDRDYDAWRIERDGTAMFAKGHATFNADGSAVIGNQSTNITMSNTGAISLTGIEVNISSANSTTIASGIIGTPAAVAILLDGQSGNVGITGKLNTADLSVGNGSCFFKGTDTAHDPVTIQGHNYGANTRGAGHLAKGNIWWDADGNLSIGGQLRLKGTSLEWGGAVQQFEYTYSEYQNNKVYTLPDPKEYLGREIFVEVIMFGDQLHSIFNGHNGLDALACPRFTIEGTDGHQWIKWGADACKYVSHEITHLPKYYKLGDPVPYKQNAGAHAVTIDTDTSATGPANLYHYCDNIVLLDSSELNNGLTGSNKGLYLIPTPTKWLQMQDLSFNNNSSLFMVLRMRCQAKKFRSSVDKYYWEILTSDFIPYFITGRYDEASVRDYDSGDFLDATNWVLTSSAFYSKYELKIASTSLAYNEYNIV